jgi:hypothetical protein
VAQRLRSLSLEVPSGRAVKVVESELPSCPAVKVVKLKAPSCRSVTVVKLEVPSGRAVRVVDSDHNPNAFLRDHKPNNTFPRDPPQLLTFQTHLKLPKTSDFTG